MGEKKKDILDELKAQKERLDGLIKSFGESSLSQGASPDAGDSQQSTGLLGAMDLSDPIREVYLTLLKAGDKSIDEMMEDPYFEDKESLPIYVRILARQGYVEKYKEGDSVKYRAIAGDKKKKHVSEDIWNMLD